MSEQKKVIPEASRSGQLLAVIIIFLVILNVPLNALAVSIDINITATVMAGSCIINHGNPIKVNFGDDLLTSKINGENYVKNIDYNISCTALSHNNLSLSINGDVSDFDEFAIQTDNPNLGVQLESNGEKIKVGNRLNFTYPDIPALQAVPVKRSGVELSAGEFSAGAVMVVGYD